MSNWQAIQLYDLVLRGHWIMDREGRARHSAHFWMDELVRWVRAAHDLAPHNGKRGRTHVIILGSVAEPLLVHAGYALRDHQQARGRVLLSHNGQHVALTGRMIALDLDAALAPWSPDPVRDAPAVVPRTDRSRARTRRYGSASPELGAPAAAARPRRWPSRGSPLHDATAPASGPGGAAPPSPPRGPGRQSSDSRFSCSGGGGSHSRSTSSVLSSRASSSDTSLGSGANSSPGADGPAPPAAFHSPGASLLRARRATVGGTSDKHMHKGRPVLTRLYRGDGSFGPFAKFLHEYNGWPPRLCSNYGHLRSPLAETEGGVRYFVEKLARARYTNERVPFQRNTGEELTDSLGTPLSWVPVVNKDPPQFDGKTSIALFRINARLVHYDLMWLDLGHDDGNKLPMAWFDWHTPRRARGRGDPNDRLLPPPGPGWDEDSPYTRLDLDVCGEATFHHGPGPRYLGHGANVHCDHFVSTILDGFMNTDGDSTAPGDSPSLGLGDDSSDDSSDASPASAGPSPLVLALSSSSSFSGDAGDL